MVYTRVIEAFTGEFIKKQQEYEKEFSELHPRMVRIYNELIAKVNLNAPLLPRELVNYAKHSVLKGRSELEDAILKVTKA